MDDIAARGIGGLVSTDKATARLAFDRLAQALEQCDFAGWDPYDALSSPLVRSLARTKFLRGAAIQALKRSPINFRPFLGVPKAEHAKGLALCASAYSLLGASENDERLVSIASRLVSRLLDCQLPCGGWGYHFDVQTRWSYYRAGHPNAVVTSFALFALRDLATVGKVEERHLAAEQRAVEFMHSRLLTEQHGEHYFAYYPGCTVPIHNANMLVIRALAGVPNLPASIASSLAGTLAFTLERQSEDGSWPYGEADNLRWIDNYHTAFTLDALLSLSEAGGFAGAHESLELGWRFYRDRLFDEDGAPRATDAERFPIDIHAAASSLIVLARLAPSRPDAAALASRLLDWTLENMSRPDGRFAFQQTRRRRLSTPYVRWNDSHMLLALSSIARTR